MQVEDMDRRLPIYCPGCKRWINDQRELLVFPDPDTTGDLWVCTECRRVVHTVEGDPV